MRSCSVALCKRSPGPVTAGVRQLRAIQGVGLFMRRWLGSILLVLIATLLSCQHKHPAIKASSGLPGTCTIRGKLTDWQGNPIQSAEVQLLGPSLGGERRTLSDEDGFYIFKDLPSGTDYEIVYSALGFPTAVRTGLKLRPWVTLNLPATLDWRDTWNLFPATPMIDLTDTGGTTVFIFDTTTGQMRVP